MKVSPASELDLLLAESVTAAKAREEAAFDEIAGPCRDSIVLFGARKMGRKILRMLREAGIEPLAFSDNDAALWGGKIDGVDVYSPSDAAARFGDVAVFVMTMWGRGTADPMSARQKQLEDLGCKRVISFGPLVWKFPQYFLPHTGMDLPHKALEQADSIRLAFSVLADDLSREELVAQLKWRLYFDFDALSDPVSEDIYFPSDLMSLSPDEVFVDCGAYDGDTILNFLTHTGGSYRKIIAYEPDPLNLARLRKTAAELPDSGRIRIVEAAVAESAGTVRFTGTGGLGSAMGAGETEVPCVTLDESLNGDAPTFIKMDIESAEPGALRGGAQVIRESRPTLAICAYHVQDHLWRLPEVIHDINPDYRIYLRPHIQLVEDLVCYAIAPARWPLGSA